MTEENGWLTIRKEQAQAFGKPVPDGFLVRAGSTAMRDGSPTVKRNRGERDALVADGVLVPDENPALFRFARDHVFSSNSAAAGVIIDGNSNGSPWKADASNAQQALLDRLTRVEIDAAMADCGRLGVDAFLKQGGFISPKNWVEGLAGDQTFPAKATVAAALGHLPGGRALSVKEFFNGFGEAQAFSRLKELGYEVISKSDPDSLSREAVEAAMDAYDAYQQGDEHADIFGTFGTPNEYWVRSTRPRSNRVYPTKPLIGHILNKTELNGGWTKKTHAAARLHNAGFIIVDKDDTAVMPPDQPFLIGAADRIRLCALNYFIAPARERGAAEVSIRAGDLATAMGLADAFPNICQALGGAKFQQLAQVPPPTHTEPNPSSTTTFTYNLGSPEAKTVTEKTMPTAPTNLILYGPPGTGKTYHTAWEAVRLCLGDAALPLEHDRPALMTAYRQLVAEGRVEFATFHQSMSYEEFVEGLRPNTSDGDGTDEGPEDGPTGAGFRLEPHDGVFKRISERARLDSPDSGATIRLNRSARVFKVALGRRQIEDDRIRYGLDNGLIHMGWGGDIDWSDERFDNFDEIFTEWRTQKNPQASGHDGNVVITYSFRADMQIGDYVVISDGRDRIQAFGKITGNYSYDQEAAFHPHRRTVDWLWRDAEGTDRSRFYPKAFRRHSAYKLNQSLIDWDALEAIVIGVDVPATNSSARDHVLIIDEINRANISKVFGELITLLEPDKRLGMENEIRLTLLYSKKSFGVPANLHIIGTMNTADRSIALLDTALRRRFDFRELMPDPDVLSTDLDGIDLQKLLRTINERIEYLFDREHQIGHAYFTACKTRADIEDVMRHKVIPLLAEYFYEDWSRIAAVLGDTRQDKPRFLLRKEIPAPEGLEADSLAPRHRWTVKDSFDLSEFTA